MVPFAPPLTPERDGVCAWTRADLCRWLEERFAKTYHPSSMTRVLRRMGFSRQKARPSHPRRDAEAQERFKKRGLRDILKASAAAHPDKRLQLWFQDEARVGNKGRVCHRWWRRGERAPGTRQIGYQWAYIFSAVRPDTGDDVTLVMPSVNAKVMDLFLAHFADTLDQDAHAVMMCDGAGWHDERALTVPDNVTLALLPPYSPELNPVERVWLYLRERFLSLRVLDRHRGHHRRLLPSMDRPHRRTGSYANPLRLSMDHEGDFIGSLVLVIQIDGLHVGDHVLMAAIGVDGNGDKHVLAVVEGATENTVVVQALIDNLLARGLDPTLPRLFIVDGA